MQWAYLFERFPSFTQTFCYREVAEMERQGMAPWIYAIRRPQDEPPQDFPAGLAARVRYLPGEGELGEEFRWLKRCDRLPEPLRADEQRLKGGRDKARIQEAGWLGRPMKLAGIGHVHTHFAGIAARTAYWLHRHYGISYSFTAHANDVFCPPDPDLSLTLEELVGAARFIVAVSDFGAAQLRERFPAAADKIFRVYNGIDVDAFPLAHPKKNGPRIVAVGRYIEKKGFDDLVAACALLRDRGVNFDCQIVGEGPLEHDLQAAIDRATLRERVTLTGPKPLAEVAALLGTARVFALPCVVEADGGMDNLPTVIAEGMAAGLPVVSTTLAGVPEMVIDGETGLLVSPRSPEHLADALARMVAEPATAEAFGQEGRRRARERFRHQKHRPATQTLVAGKNFDPAGASDAVERPSSAVDAVAALWFDDPGQPKNDLTVQILETNRLRLRTLNPDDAAFMLQLVNEPAWLRFIGDRNIQTLEAARAYILNSYVTMYERPGFGLWLVERKEGTIPIGVCGLLKRESLEDVDLGFAFLSAHRRNGYAFEASTATISYARDALSLTKVVAILSPDNAASRRLLEKLGFRFERTTKLSDGAPEVMLYAATI